jgi:hypothetical protein
MNHALQKNSQVITATEILPQAGQILEDVRNILNTRSAKSRVVNEKKKRNIGGNKMSKFLK